MGCREFGLDYEYAAVDELISVIRGRLKEPPGACHPKDIVNQICWAARYEESDAVLNREAILAAVEAYFVSGNEVVNVQ